MTSGTIKYDPFCINMAGIHTSLIELPEEVPMNAISSTHITQPQATRPKRRLLTWTKRILLGLATLLIALVLTGVAYQAIGVQADRRNYPPPGKLFDVGGYRLHLYCTGPQNSGNPTVILDTLSGGTSANWGWVQPEVARVTRVCSYDRAGYGWSEPSQHPQTLVQTVRDLHTLLQKAGVAGPYVLVGHSIGGVYMRKYAADYPDGVVGMVLVDTAHPDQFARYPELKSENDAYIRMSAAFPTLARIGLFRLYFATGGEIDFKDLPARQHAEVAMFWSSPEYFASQRAENLALSAIYADSHSLGSLGNLPLAVVSRGKGEPAYWDDLQNEIAALSSNSLHITVPVATHPSLALNQEDALVTSSVILQVVQAARTGQLLVSK
jgi:pimeloyl-ACP methyl ester carboxylesterase